MLALCGVDGVYVWVPKSVSSRWRRRSLRRPLQIRCGWELLPSNSANVVCWASLMEVRPLGSRLVRPPYLYLRWPERITRLRRNLGRSQFKRRWLLRGSLALLLAQTTVLPVRSKLGIAVIWLVSQRLSVATGVCMRRSWRVC